MSRSFEFLRVLIQSRTYASSSRVAVSGQVTLSTTVSLTRSVFNPIYCTFSQNISYQINFPLTNSVVLSNGLLLFKFSIRVCCQNYCFFFFFFFFTACCLTQKFLLLTHFFSVLLTKVGSTDFKCMFFTCQLSTKI